jgi:hypothetical protein
MSRKFYVLIEDGAEEPEDGVYYGVKGQAVVCDDGYNYKLLNPRPDQYEDEFYLDPARLKELT